MHITEKFTVEQKERIVIESFTATNIAELCNRYTMPSAQFHRWKEQYEIVNNESSWTEFMERYICMKTEISLEVSTSGKYVARKLRDMGFSIHMADPSKLPLIFNTEKKNDREYSY